MAKAAIVDETPYVDKYDIQAELGGSTTKAALADETDPLVLESTNTNNDALQSELEAQRAMNEEPDRPLQPYVLESSAYRNELIAKKAKLDGDIANLEGQRDGINARIDDMNQTRNSVAAGLAVLT